MLGHGGACRASRSAEAAQLGAALGSTAPCRSPSEAKEPGREPQANSQQPGWTETLVPGEASGPAAISGDPSTPSPPACSCLQAPAALHGTMLRPGPGCRAAGNRNLGGEGNMELQLHHLPSASRVPAPATSRAALTCCPLPSLPPRAPRISKESQRQLPRHRRVSGSPMHARSGVHGQGCA